MTNRLGDALRLAGAGLHVFPLKPLGKEPATKNGCLDATRDPAALHRMFSAAGTDANVGVATGLSGLVVVDLDNPEARTRWLELSDQHGAHAPTVASRTPRGWHLYYRALPGKDVRNSTSKLAPDIDTRGLGGYVVAPPSYFVADPESDKVTGPYRWSSVQHPLADLPSWIPDALDPPRMPAPPPILLTGTSWYATAALRGEVQRVVDAAPGTRNTTLRAAAWALGTLVGAQVLQEAEAQTALRLAGEAAGLPAPEVERTVSRGIRDGSRSPRQLRAAA